MQSDPSVTLQPDAHSGRIRQGSISAAVPHCRDSDAASQMTVGVCVERNCGLAAFLPSGAQRFQAGSYTYTLAHHLPSGICTVIVQCVLDAEFQTVYSQFFGELIVKLLLRDGRLRHAKSAERPRWNQMSVHGACHRAVVWHFVRSASMYRYTPRH